MCLSRSPIGFAVLTIAVALVFGAQAYVQGPAIAAAAGKPCGQPNNPCPPPPPPPPSGPPVLHQFNGSAGDSLGSSVAFANVTGDGTPDVIIGAENANGGAGYVKIFNGADFSLVRQIDGNAGDFFGARVAVGDINGDGVPDIVVGAYGVDVGGATDAGAVRVYDGATGSLLYQLNGTGSTDFFGSAVAVGDITGDGKADILVGAWGADLGGGSNANIGYVRLFDGANGALLAQFNGDNIQDEMGRAVAFGDVNGDGTLDIILGAGSSTHGNIPHFGGYVRVIDGKDFTHILYEFDAGLPRTTKPEPNFGYAVAAADVDGDGHADVIVAAYRGKLSANGTSGPAAGYVRVFSGVTGAMLYQLNGTADRDEFGRSVALGDVTGDGVPDIIVGAPGVLTATTTFGYVRVFDGTNGALLFQVNATSVAELFGYSVAAANVDSSGSKANVAVGAYYGNVTGLNGNGYVRIFED